MLWEIREMWEWEWELWVGNDTLLITNMSGCQDRRANMTYVTTLHWLHASRQIYTQGAVHLQVPNHGMAWLGFTTRLDQPEHCRFETMSQWDDCWLLESMRWLGSREDKRRTTKDRDIALAKRWRPTGLNLHRISLSLLGEVNGVDDIQEIIWKFQVNRPIRQSFPGSVN